MWHGCTADRHIVPDARPALKPLTAYLWSLPTMLIATWNLNHRVGTTRYRPEAARAAASLDADLIVLTEYFPKGSDHQFQTDLMDCGYPYLLLSAETGERANRVLIASKEEIQPVAFDLPTFDRQFPANVLVVRHAKQDLVVAGIRVPYYESGAVELRHGWGWIHGLTQTLSGRAAVVAGDLNVALKSAPGRGGDIFRSIIGNGWTRAAPASGHSFPRAAGGGTEIDHVLASPCCAVGRAWYALRTPSFELAGSGGLSDHAALFAEVRIASV